MKKTIILGASANPARVSYDAALRLKKLGHEVIAISNREGSIEGIPIRTDLPALKDVDTVTLYLNPSRQPEYYDYILNLAPRRLIFNPGTENVELMKLAKEQGIETEFACTLVMLAIGSY